jgi:hypothetical protein
MSLSPLVRLIRWLDLPIERKTWPDVRGQQWPVDEIPVFFLIQGQLHSGWLHHLNAHTAWVKFENHLIKRHIRKHQVAWT